MKILRYDRQNDREQLLNLFTEDLFTSPKIDEQVAAIIAEVRRRGDAALVDFTRKFDHVELKISELEVAKETWQSAKSEIDRRVMEALETARDNIEAFHRRQVEQGWQFERQGVRLQQRNVPLARVGIYVPGGQALYPSSVLMMAIPARLAGVEQIVMVTPPGKDGLNPHLLAAARLAGVDECYQVGGAQAVAALAYGTDRIRKVDKIVGPGNNFVAAAKRQVFGVVDIDNIAGPSEIVVLADDHANAEWIAYDLISQLEHDADAKAVLVTDSLKLAERVSAHVDRLVPIVKRSEIVAKAVEKNAVAFLVANLSDGIAIVDEIAPEHLEVITADSAEDAERISNAGCIFVGAYSPVPMGDYIAGTNHTLPTARTARFGSPLGVGDFCKKISVVEYDQDSFLREGRFVETLAEIENLPNHAEAVRVRRRGMAQAGENK